jgi:hypothetical protein
MRRRTWWTILGILAAIAAGVQVIWFIIMTELEIQVPTGVMILLLFFPGGMAWMMPLGFAYLWKDEVDKPQPDSEPQP